MHILICKYTRRCRQGSENGRTQQARTKDLEGDAAGVGDEGDRTCLFEVEQDVLLEELRGTETRGQANACRVSWHEDLQILGLAFWMTHRGQKITVGVEEVSEVSTDCVLTVSTIVLADEQAAAMH